MNLEVSDSFLWLVAVMGQLSLQGRAEVLVNLPKLADSAILEQKISKGTIN